MFSTANYFQQRSEQMKEEILDTKKDKEKYMHEVEWMNEEVQSLFSESFVNQWLNILKIFCS